MEETEDIIIDEEVFAEEDYDPGAVVSDSVTLYLKQISEIPLLTFEEEKELALRVAEGDKYAKDELVNHNLRLVVSVAKRYRGCGLSFLDLIQEGNIGLIKAAEKYDLNKGYRFSTYATWWVRQTISRALSDQSRSIRIPANIAELLGKIKRTSTILTQKLKRAPTDEEIATELNTEVEKVKLALEMSKIPSSLDTPIGEDEDTNMGDLVADHCAENPLRNMIKADNLQMLKDLFSTLSPKESKVLQLRFGIDEDHAHTLEEIGTILGVTKERIRQIETKALRKMRNPVRLAALKECI